MLDKLKKTIAGQATNLKDSALERASQFKVVSGDEGVIKPDPRIFRVLLERYRIRPEEAVFIDDNPANAAAAAALGIHGIHFRSPTLLRGELESLDLL